MIDHEKFGPDVPIGRRIRALAVLRKMSATELATRMEVPEQRIYDLYSSRTHPSKDEVHRFADIFKASLKWLTTGIGDPLRVSPFRRPPQGIYPKPEDEAERTDETLARLSDRIRRAAKGGT